jgi:hypothetical protein
MLQAHFKSTSLMMKLFIWMTKKYSNLFIWIRGVIYLVCNSYWYTNELLLFCIIYSHWLVSSFIKANYACLCTIATKIFFRIIYYLYQLAKNFKYPNLFICIHGVIYLLCNSYWYTNELLWFYTIFLHRLVTNFIKANYACLYTITTKNVS